MITIAEFFSDRNAQNLRRIKQRKGLCFIQESGGDVDDQGDNWITPYTFQVFRSQVCVAATIFWRKNAQIDWHKTAINDVTNFFKQRKHALCEKYYGAVFALIENFLTGNWAA